MRQLYFIALIVPLGLSSLACEMKNPNADRMKDLFLPPAAYLVGANPTTVTAADFNRDGNLDIITTNVEDDSLSFLQGNGDGTFRDEVKIRVGSQPRTLAVGDFNGDGKLDIALNLIGNTTEVVIMLGQGDGSFKEGEHYPTEYPPLSIAAADFNHDHKLDLVVAVRADKINWS